MGKSGGSSTTTNSLDPAMQQRIADTWKAIQGSAGAQQPGVDPLTQQAAGGYQQAAQAGGLGLSALTGDRNSYDQLANPYQQHVLSGLQSQFGQQRQQTLGAIDDYATRAGAFGGSRQGVAQGQALGDLGRNQDQQYGQALYQGFNDTMGRAGGLAQMGQQANGSLASLGDYSRNVQMQSDPRNWAAQTLGNGLRGLPYGQNQTTSNTPGHNGLTGAIGGALGGFASAGPWGALFGGLGGALG